MTEAAPLTILLGPQTGVSLALNSLVRENRRVLAKAGMTALPSRVASPLLRRCLDGRSAAEREAEFQAETHIRPALLSAVNFLGPPQAGLMKGEMFPDAEMALAGLGDLARGARIVMAVDALPAFFLAAGSEPLEARVRRTPWEVLYELSWADLAREIIAALPGAELLVLTPVGAGREAARVMREIFGAAIAAMPDRHALLRTAISQTGRAVLDRMLSAATPAEETLGELYTSFALRPTRAELAERLAIDKLTSALLDQRFAEDLETIATLPGARVI